MRILLLSILTLSLTSLTAQTLPSVQEAYKIFQAKCISCHDHASPEGGLDLEGQGASEYARAVNVAQKLVNFTPTNAFAQAQGDKRVYPGRPDRSFLFRKVNSGFEPSVSVLHADEGTAMPNYPGTPLTSLEKEIIRQWIFYGAKTTGVQFNKALIENFYNLGGEKSFPDGPPPAPAPGEGFQIKMGPFYLAPGEEVEYYQKYELNLPADVEVDRLQFNISGYSHHFLLYNFGTQAGANAIPAGLRLDADHSDISLVAAVQGPTDLQLPEGTAFKWDNKIVLDLNSHYINYSATQPYQCEVYVDVYTKPAGTALQEMFADLLVNAFIPIPNNGNVITHTQSEYTPGADSIYIWGLMGHTHKYGNSYKVWKRLPGNQKGELIYDASCPFGMPGCPAPTYDYQHIPLRYWEPLLPLKWGNGIIHEASWINTGPASVGFGPTSDDEMMVLIAFYTLQPLTTATGDPQVQGADQAVQVSPNPARESVTITAPGGQSLRSFRLFTVAGQEVLRRDNLPAPSFELPLGGLKPGMYLFQADGWTGKLIVE